VTENDDNQLYVEKNENEKENQETNERKMEINSDNELIHEHDKNLINLLDESDPLRATEEHLQKLKRKLPPNTVSQLATREYLQKNKEKHKLEQQAQKERERRRKKIIK